MAAVFKKLAQRRILPLGGGKFSRVLQCSGATIINGQVFLGGHEQLGSPLCVCTQHCSVVAMVVSSFCY